MSDNSFSTGLIDTHAHLQDRGFRDDFAAMLLRARDSGIRQIVTVGTTVEDSADAAEMARTHAGLFATVGVHPNEASRAKTTDWEAIVALVGQPKVVALGETGLDRYRTHTPFPLQQEWFGRHLKFAIECDLPVVIHSRESDRDILEQLSALGRPVRGVMHSFTGTWEFAQAFLDLGLHISFAGMITFGNKTLDPLREVAARVPIDRLLVETDSPYLSPHPFRGKPNEPGRAAVTAAKVAELRGMTLENLSVATTANARALFRLDPTWLL